MDWWITFDQQAADYLPDLRIEKEEPMDRHTSFRIGGPARRMAFPERGEQLVLLLDMAARCGARPLVMGNGTNLLAPDEGLDRLGRPAGHRGPFWRRRGPPWPGWRISPAGRGWRAWSSPTASRARWAARYA